MANIGVPMKVGVCVLLLCMVIGAPSAQAITCSDVTEAMIPCISYLTGSGGPAPAVPCCNGVRSVNNRAQTTADRQTVCKCLESDANTIPGLQPNLVAGLPSSCGVNLPYKFSTSTDCNRYNLLHIIIQSVSNRLTYQ